MTRLDRHVATVQSKLFIRRFLEALAWATVVLAAATLLAVLVQKLFQVFPEAFPVKWVLIGAGVVCVAVALGYAFLKKPTRQQAAAAIDERLRLKEKFSTAIFVRPSSDPFAMAAVRDAERTAENVQLGKQFPVPFPKPAYTAMLLACGAFALTFLQPINLFGQKNPPQKKQETEVAQQAAKEAVARAIAAVESMPKSAQASDEFRKLVAELHAFNKAPKIDDPSKANRRALQALQEVNNQAYKEYDKVKKYAEAQNQLMQALQPPDDAKGPVGDARKEIAKSNFNEAAQKLEEAVKNFDKMTQEQKKDAAKQMEQAAAQLQQLANNPQMQEQVKQQLQQMGASKDQAQKMQELMQQAAQGGQKGQAAAQQLQQEAQKMAQQMNNGQGPNQQQQQQMQQAMQQMQAQANAQNQAQGLSQAAQQMAQAMQQAQAQGQQGQQGQQAQGQQGQQGQQVQQGQQQGGQQAAQQMAQAQQNMQQALQNMQGVKQDLQQMAQQAQQAQQAMQQGQQCANGQCEGGAQGQQGQGQKLGQGQGQGQGPFAEGQVPQGQQGQGRGGPGQAAGGDSGKATSPFGVKMEQSPSQDNEKGRVLASYLVKDKADPGKMRMAMQEVEKAAKNEATDEVDAEHANRAAQKVAQEYFRTMQETTQKK
jgi:hypothetical protein